MDPLPDHEHAALGDVVRQLRARQRLTQETVAARAGVSRKYLTDLESGRRRASWDGVVRVTRAMGISLVEVADLYERRAAG